LPGIAPTAVVVVIASEEAVEDFVEHPEAEELELVLVGHVEAVAIIAVNLDMFNVTALMATPKHVTPVDKEVTLLVIALMAEVPLNEMRIRASVTIAGKVVIFPAIVRKEAQEEVVVWVVVMVAVTPATSVESRDILPVSAQAIRAMIEAGIAM